MIEKYRGAFVGAACGDALGFITEFSLSANDLRDHYGIDLLTDFIPWNRITKHQGKYLIKLPFSEGAYSDDTQLTLSTARALRADGSLDVRSFAKYELPAWLMYETGGGSGTKAAARNLLRSNVDWYNNFFDFSYTQYINSGGNGAAMRILPIALANHKSEQMRNLGIWQNTITSHGHPRGIIGAALFSDSIVTLLNSLPDKKDLLGKLIARCETEYTTILDTWSQAQEFHTWQSEWSRVAKRSFRDSFDEILKETILQLKLVQEYPADEKMEPLLAQLGCYDRRTKGAGNSTVVAAVAYVCRVKNFEDGLVTVANQIGIDTDTIGYFVGAMLGAHYGIRQIPNRFAERVQDAKYLLKLADWCYSICSGTSIPDDEYKYPLRSANDQIRNIQIKKIGHEGIGAEIQVPILGVGVIKSNVDITPNWKGKHIYWSKIVLSHGQTIYVQSLHNHVEKPNIKKPGIKPEKKGEEAVVAALALLDGYKKRIEIVEYSDEVIVDVLREIKQKRDRALYNAFTTWLWAALPEKKIK